MKKLSIIIPCYNAEKYIDNCLEKIYFDKLDQKEIILINDGSTDDTLKIMKKHSLQHPEIKIINQKNCGQAVARNKGIKAASGKYITFLDIDDFIASNAFKKMYEFAELKKSDYVYCDYFEHSFSNDKIISNYHTDNPKKNAVLANFAPWGKIISRKLIEDTNFEFLEEKIFEDIAVIPYLASCSTNPQHLKEPLIYYNMTNISTTRKRKFDSRFIDIIYVSDYLYNLFLEHNLLEEYYEELKYIYIDSILRSGVLKFSKYKEGIPYITILRKNVMQKFNRLLKNVYLKKETNYRKLTALLSVYCPAKILYLLKKLKG